MNKEQIKSEMQSIEESIKKETERLNALRLEMDKPEKPTLEEMCKVMYRLFASGEINKESGYTKDGYLSRERAEKEKLRIKLSVIADYLNDGEIKNCDNWFYHLYIHPINQSINIHTTKSFSGCIYFKTREHAELAMSYFTNDELIKMLR